MGRQRVKKIRAERKEKRKQWSILKLQTTMRKWVSRRIVRVRRARLKQSKRLWGVTHIQRVVRGFMGRRRAKQRKLLLSIDIWVQIRLGDAIAVEDAYNGVDTEQPLNAETKDSQGNTLLIAAARYGHLKVTDEHCDLCKCPNLMIPLFVACVFPCKSLFEKAFNGE